MLTRRHLTVVTTFVRDYNFVFETKTKSKKTCDAHFNAHCKAISVPLLESCLFGLKRRKRKAEATPLGLAEGVGVPPAPPARAPPGDRTGDPPSPLAAAAAAWAGDGTPCIGARFASGAAVGMGVARPEPWASMEDSACK